MKKNSREENNIQQLTIAAFIAALYVVLTYIANAVGLASGVIQIRLSDILCVMPYFTAAAVPGLFVGCFLANLLTGCCALDMIVGSLATLIGAYFARKIRHTRYLVPIPTVLANALLIPIVLIYGYGVNLNYFYLFATVGVGELISVGLLGSIFLHSLSRVSFFANMVD